MGVFRCACLGQRAGSRLHRGTGFRLPRCWGSAPRFGEPALARLEALVDLGLGLLPVLGRPAFRLSLRFPNGVRGVADYLFPAHDNAPCRDAATHWPNPSFLIGFRGSELYRRSTSKRRASMIRPFLRAEPIMLMSIQGLN